MANGAALFKLLLVLSCCIQLSKASHLARPRPKGWRDGLHFLMEGAEKYCDPPFLPSVATSDWDI